MAKVPLASGEPPPPDQKAVVEKRLRRERNRMWCLIGTFVLSLLMIVSFFVLVLSERSTAAFVMIAPDIGVMASWQAVIRYYFPPPRVDPPRPGGRRPGRSEVGGDSEAA